MKSWERLCLIASRSEAMLFDFVLLFLVRILLRYAGVGYVYFQPVLKEVSPPFSPGDILDYPVSSVFYGSMFFVSGIPELVMVAMWIIYGALFLSATGQTLGMRRAGLRLIDSSLRKPCFFRVLLRQMIRPISSIIWMGYWPVLWTRYGSSLHDLISGTRVVPTTEEDEPETAV